MSYKLSPFVMSDNGLYAFWTLRFLVGTIVTLEFSWTAGEQIRNLVVAYIEGEKSDDG
jgi:hypothetical protein